MTKTVFVICVELLDNSIVECTLSADSLGYDCLDNVCQRLGLNQVRLTLTLFLEITILTVLSPFDSLNFLDCAMSVRSLTQEFAGLNLIGPLRNS